MGKDEARFGLHITAGQRDYYNYRYDPASLECEMKKLHSSARPQARDFRSRQEREEEDHRQETQRVL